MQNRRREPRFVVEGLHGRMTFASDVEIVNMSLSGCAVKLDRRLNMGAAYTLKLESGNSLAVRAQVVWESLAEMRKGVNGEARLVYAAGLRFDDLLSERARELLAYIDRNKVAEEKRLGGVRFHIDAPGKALLDVPAAYRVRVISLSGMLIHTDVALDLDRRYAMEVALDDGAPLVFDGRVAYCQEAGDGPDTHHEIGVEFGELTPADRNRLTAYLRLLSPE